MALERCKLNTRNSIHVCKTDHGIILLRWKWGSAKSIIIWKLFRRSFFPQAITCCFFQYWILVEEIILLWNLNLEFLSCDKKYNQFSDVFRHGWVCQTSDDGFQTHWGFSVSNVPYIRKMKLRWKKTAINQVMSHELISIK